jgi:fumarate reductase subunit C
MAIRRTYVRPVAGWWRSNPFFLRYMAREVTAIFVAAYALVLLAGVVRLSQGRAAFEEWQDGLQSPLSIAFHVLLLAVFAYHTWSWFSIMPKTLPPIDVAGRRLSAPTITAFGIAASVAASAIVCIGIRTLAA